MISTRNRLGAERALRSLSVRGRTFSNSSTVLMRLLAASASYSTSRRGYRHRRGHVWNGKGVLDISSLLMIEYRHYFTMGSASSLNAGQIEQISDESPSRFHIPRVKAGVTSVTESGHVGSEGAVTAAGCW